MSAKEFPGQESGKTVFSHITNNDIHRDFLQHNAFNQH